MEIDTIAHFEEVVARMNAEKKAEKQKHSIIIDPNETFDGNDGRNIGYAALSCIYHELEIDKFFTYRQRSMNTEYNMNAIMRLLTFARLLSPGSKSKAYNEREWFFERCDFTPEIRYRRRRPVQHDRPDRRKGDFHGPWVHKYFCAADVLVT